MRTPQLGRGPWKSWARFAARENCAADSVGIPVPRGDEKVGNSACGKQGRAAKLDKSSNLARVALVFCSRASTIRRLWDVPQQLFLELASETTAEWHLISSLLEAPAKMNETEERTGLRPR